MPFILLVAGPNGAGKTSFATHLLARAPTAKFVNADDIARVLPNDLDPRKRDLKAARDMIATLRALVADQKDIILETTLSGHSYLQAIPAWRLAGYEVDLHYLRLEDADASLARVRKRVTQGNPPGHDIPEDVVRRRFPRSLERFEECKSLVDRWYLYDSLDGRFVAVLSGERYGPETEPR